MRRNIHEIAVGRWHGILAGLGLSSVALSGRHTTCPCCGGKDRFRFDDKEGRGTFYCSHCGPGSGVDLVMRLKGLTFKDAAREIEALAGGVPANQLAPGQSDDRKMTALRRVWSEATSLTEGDEVVRYLTGRGLQMESIPGVLRLHSGLAYRYGGAVLGVFPAMLAMVTGPDGKAVTLHRTYLKDGCKAPVPEPRKLMPGKLIRGGAIRLATADNELGVAEGIETALAAQQLFGIPVWSCLSAGGIESFEPLAGVRTVVVFADNDANFTGQRAAFSLANRLAMRGIETDVKVPDIVGDWLDVLVAMAR